MLADNLELLLWHLRPKGPPWTKKATCRPYQPGPQVFETCLYLPRPCPRSGPRAQPQLEICPALQLHMSNMPFIPRTQPRNSSWCPSEAEAHDGSCSQGCQSRPALRGTRPDPEALPSANSMLGAQI